MGEFAECIQGIKEACEFLNYQLFQEMCLFIMAQIIKIFIPPVIGGVGLIDKLSGVISHNFKKDKSNILVIGKTFGHLQQSCFLRENFQQMADLQR